MAAIEVRMSPDPDTLDKDVVLAAMDDDIERFSKYMEGLAGPVGCPLSRPERALLKTYLVAKLRGKI
jgi:hypothetical protein